MGKYFKILVIWRFQTTSQEWKINPENLRIMNFYTFYVMTQVHTFQRFTIWVPSWNSIANTKCKGWTTRRWVWITGQTLKTQMKQFWFGVTPVDTLMPCIFCPLPLHSLRDHLHLPEKSKVHLNGIKFELLERCVSCTNNLSWSKMHCLRRHFNWQCITTKVILWLIC